ncbi:hypothetical protein [Saliphagus sp. LR7]|uniref:hypothetical protein n=1 Tax=Saliphagus sp. LR7 TaxID=2282654 RepID=UPI000DF835D1|nr:hypothetical protein [Saliphagus sp. LR7]
METELVESRGASRLKTAAATLLIIAALMAFLFVARGQEGGSVMSIDRWVLTGSGFLIAGVLIMWENL